jgi:hypothetical protein
MAYLNAETGVRWCQSPIIAKTTPNSNHQRLKLTRRAGPRMSGMCQKKTLSPGESCAASNEKNRFTVVRIYRRTNAEISVVMSSGIVSNIDFVAASSAAAYLPQLIHVKKCNHNFS